jgi:ABC-2 type transport system permease protein
VHNALLIARHDLRRRLRDRSAVVTAFIAPLVLASIMGLAFANSGGAFLRVAIVDQDHTATSAQLVDAVIRTAGLGVGVRLDRVASESVARGQFERGNVGAVVIIRPGASASGPAGPIRRTDVLSDSHRPYAEQVARAFVAGLAGEAQAEQLAVRTAAGPGLIPSERFSALLGAARQQASPAVVITNDPLPAKQGELGYFGPSMAIIFLFLGIGAGARSLLGERDTGTLARLKAAPIGMGQVVAGKVGAVLALALLSILTVWGGTVLVFGASWGAAPAVVVLCIATVLGFGGIALLMTVLAKTQAQADASMAIVAFTLALLGGNFFPPGSLPPSLERLTLATPNGWALQGFGNLALDRSGFAGITLPLVVLLTIGLSFGLVALTRLRSLVAASA